MATLKATRIYQFITNNHGTFYLSWKQNLLNHQKVSKYDCKNMTVTTKFQLKQTILIFWTKFAPKRAFSILNRKSEHYHWIVYIRISLDTKFQLTQTILFTPGYFHNTVTKYLLGRIWPWYHLLRWTFTYGTYSHGITCKV